jgi:hypothetical protein
MWQSGSGHAYYFEKLKTSNWSVEAICDKWRNISEGICKL